MRAFIQRVSYAKVTVDGKITGEIGAGLLVLLGLGHADNESEAAALARKLVNLRVFNDNLGKMNLSLLDVLGEMLAISQFTLHADTRKGNRPSFTEAMEPEQASSLYDYFCTEVEKLGLTVRRGIFGAHMKVTLENDGPVSIMVYSKNEYQSK
ncbi:MAG: D-aminoacyl-tRNA deacylase [Candidatus Wallbacteria bacterium]|nr:D-aminoacyl-tRNA deacylase [Candidatus Wallbacteria bacterium]